MFSLQRQTFSIKISFTVFHIYIYIFHFWQAILLPTVSRRITRLVISQRLMINLSRMEKRGWIDDTVRGCGVTIVDSGITVISDDLCVDKIRDGGHRCRPVESSRWHWSEGFNRGPRLVRSPRTSWLSNLGHGARYAFILDSYAFHTGRFTSSVVPLFFFLFFLLLLLPRWSLPRGLPWIFELSICPARKIYFLKSIVNYFKYHEEFDREKIDRFLYGCI